MPPPQYIIIGALLLPITKVDSLGVYNTRTKACPNLSIEVEGYTTLIDLQLDLTDYFHSLTFPPTISPAPSESPSAAPSISPTSIPSLEPTYYPTNIPTKAPITARPTPPPTGAIRVPQDPTKSPSPTIEVVVVNPGGGGGTSGPPPTQPDRKLRAPAAASPTAAIDVANNNNSPTIATTITRFLQNVSITKTKRSRDHTSAKDEDGIIVDDLQPMTRCQ